MKILLSILSLVLIMPIGYTQDLKFQNLKSCRIYIPYLTTSYKTASEKQKQFYIKQWRVIANMYEGKELLLRYFDADASNVVSKKVIIVKELNRKDFTIILTLCSLSDSNKSIESIDIYSDKLQQAKLYEINCYN